MTQTNQPLVLIWTNIPFRLDDFHEAFHLLTGTFSDGSGTAGVR
jgi:hypothetical protein